MISAEAKCESCQKRCAYRFCNIGCFKNFRLNNEQPLDVERKSGISPEQRRAGAKL